MLDAVHLREWHDRIVFTNGCYDLLHPGHLQTLLFCDDLRKSGQGAVVVAINSDDSVRRIKGSDRPVVDEMSRATLLAALFFVDFVVIFGEDTPADLIRAMCPDIIVKGGDYVGTSVIGSETGAEIVFAPYDEAWSTTKIIGKIRERR